MEGHEQIAEFIKRKKDLEKQVEIQQSEIDRLREELSLLASRAQASGEGRKIRGANYPGTVGQRIRG